MLVIGGRSQQNGHPGRQVELSPPLDASAVERRPDQDPIDAEVGRAINSYHAGLMAESVIGSVGGVEVQMRLDGEVLDVFFAEHVPLRYDTNGMGELVVHAMRSASLAAADRRKELAENITFFGEPALERQRQMAADPEDSLDDLSAVRYW